VLDIVATAAPGIDDILVLGRVKALARDEDVDLVVLDAPAAGHAVTFLQSARGLVDAVSGGPIHTQASEVLEMLGDPARCQVVLVTLPEETPVNELVDTAFALEDRVGVSLGPIVVNGSYADHQGLDADLDSLAGAAELGPDDLAALRSAAAFRLERVATQAEETTRLAAALPLAQIVLPYVFAAGLDAADIDGLVAHLLAGVEALP
jgi:anion-transporting  ArsA/GET3 family ATPase